MHSPSRSIPRILVENADLKESLGTLQIVRSIAPYSPTFLVGFWARGAHRRLRAYAVGGVDDVFLIGVAGDLARAELMIRQAAKVAAVVRDRVTGVPQGSLGTAITAWCVRNSYRRWRIADVAAHFRVSVRTLERAMREARQPPVSAVLRNCLIERAETLYETTDCSWSAIASMLGFSSSQALLMLRSRSRASARRNSRS